MAAHPVFWPGKSHAQRSLVGSSLWGHKEEDMTERRYTRAVFVLWLLMTLLTPGRSGENQVSAAGKEDCTGRTARSPEILLLGAASQKLLLFRPTSPSLFHLWADEIWKCSFLQEAALAERRQSGRLEARASMAGEEQRVGGSCWVELNVKGAIWIRGAIQKTRSKSGDGLSFILICPEGCSWPLLRSAWAQSGVPCPTDGRL